MKCRWAKSRGFTLVEILVAIAIMMSLILMASGVYITYLSEADESVLNQNITMLRAAIQQFYADHGRYPYDGVDRFGNRISFQDNNSSELVQGVHNATATPADPAYPFERIRYLHEIPIDPSTNLANWYVLPSDNDCDWRKFNDYGADDEKLTIDAGQGNGYWDTGESLNDDKGEDGVGVGDPGYTTKDTGEGDGKPTRGEPNVDEDGFLDGDQDGDGIDGNDPPDVMSIRSANSEFDHL